MRSAADNCLSDSPQKRLGWGRNGVFGATSRADPRQNVDELSKEPSRPTQGMGETLNTSSNEGGVARCW